MPRWPGGLGGEGGVRSAAVAAVAPALVAGYVGRAALMLRGVGYGGAGSMFVQSFGDLLIDFPDQSGSEMNMTGGLVSQIDFHLVRTRSQKGKEPERSYYS
jgi:hypothetical protein